MRDKRIILEKGGYRVTSPAPANPPTRPTGAMTSDGYRPSAPAPATPSANPPAAPASG
jgi:hypothetical protein